jgi:hypothetical protein
LGHGIDGRLTGPYRRREPNLPAPLGVIKRPYGSSPCASAQSHSCAISFLISDTLPRSKVPSFAIRRAQCGRLSSRVTLRDHPSLIDQFEQALSGVSGSAPLAYWATAKMRVSDTPFRSSQSPTISKAIPTQRPNDNPASRTPDASLIVADANKKPSLLHLCGIPSDLPALFAKGVLDCHLVVDEL